MSSGIRCALLACLFAIGCGGGAADITYDEFLVALPSAACDYYLSCGDLAEDSPRECVDDLSDDVERDLGCFGARGLYPELKESLARCLNGQARPCGSSDDLDLFCPALRLLEEACGE